MGFTVQLLQRKPLCPGVFELGFTRPETLRFKPGQHMRFHYQGGERDYTPIGLDTDSDIRICVRQEARPGFSELLCTCEMGTTFEASGPHGYFVFHPSESGDPPPVFVATGTGIAPFVAFACAGATGYILVQGAATTQGLIYRDIVSEHSRSYVPCISQNPSGKGAFFDGRVTDYLARVLPQGKYQFYLCGQGQMILDCMDIIDEIFPDSRVFTERFS